jgi:hypothetical protein
MNPFKTNFWQMAALITTMGAATLNAKTAPTAPPAATRSVFVVPTSSKDGRDPFYPESIRTVEQAPVGGHTTVDTTALKVPGISGTPGHFLAIINNHTFAVGDEGDVMTTSGRVHLRCIEIDPDVVVVEINGHLHRINVEAQ